MQAYPVVELSEKYHRLVIEKKHNSLTQSHLKSIAKKYANKTLNELHLETFRLENAFGSAYP